MSEDFATSPNDPEWGHYEDGPCSKCKGPGPTWGVSMYPKAGSFSFGSGWWCLDCIEKDGHDVSGIREAIKSLQGQIGEP